MINRSKRGLLSGRFSPVILLVLLVLAISFITRLALLIKTGKSFDWSVVNVLGAFVLGAFYDLAMSAYVLIPFVLHIWFINDKIYHGVWKRIALPLFAIIVVLLLFTKVVPSDFSPELKQAITFYVVLRFIIYVSLLFTSFRFRQKWRTGVLYFAFFLTIFLLLFNAVSEWFFWDEFSVRYNFIAVDYLIYTNEVVGNIKESYPLPVIISAVFAATVIVFFIVRRVLKRAVYTPASFAPRSVAAVAFLCLPLLSFFCVKEEWRSFSRNEYANELAGNGVYQFTHAFWHNELDFFKFYQTIPDAEAFSIVRSELSNANTTFTGKDSLSIERQITYPLPEQRSNVVLISVESLSASFMKAFGSTESITPYLDSLAQHSIFFTNLYATGTRTVRGLEALSLAMPPLPGQSIVKRPDNANLFTLGGVFKSKGYVAQYIYGGYSYFDNMKQYFSNNGYEVIDRDALKPEEVHYQNIWGVADEDLFALAGKTLDRNYAQGKSFFTQIMTVSNHRPYTYPEGRIDIPPQRQVRQGAVKYTDYAINKFLTESQSKPWFRNTIFVIVADHCAGSAGSVQLPVTGYHIPMLIYAPALIKPQQFSRLTSQIDIAPTILGLLRFNYTSQFFGNDVLNTAEGKERAFISTYQGLGFIDNNKLIIQSPVKKVKQYAPDFKTGTATEEKLSDTLARKAIAFYQAAAWLMKKRVKSH